MATFIHSRPRSTDITAMPSTWLKLTIHSATMHHERCSREIDGKAIAIDPGYLKLVHGGKHTVKHKSQRSTKTCSASKSLNIPYI